MHELYMRPYNYVSYEMGGSNPSQYNYHYQTHHPNYPEYSSYYSSSYFPAHPPMEFNQPDYHQPPSKYPQQPQPQEYNQPSPYPEPYTPYNPTFYTSPAPALFSYSTLAPKIKYLPKTTTEDPTTPDPRKDEVSKVFVRKITP